MVCLPFNQQRTWISFSSLNDLMALLAISKLRHLVPKHTLINIYRSLVAPYLSYGLIVWGQARKSHLDKLLKLQKRALRFIYFADRNQHAIPLFSDAGILPLQFSYYEVTANLMYDIRHRNAPRNIWDLFQDISNIHSYNTRSSTSNNFYTESSRLSIQLNSFSRIGTTIWNEMPFTLRNLSKYDFKRKIKSQSTFRYCVFGRLLSWHTKRHSKGQIFLSF